MSGSGNPFQANLNATFAGWGYMRLDDPGQAKLPIASIVRSDGKVLNTNNYWTSIHYEPVTNFKDTYLNILDLVNLGSYTYTVTYTNLPPNTNAPVTSLMFAGPSVYTNGVYYVTPQTQMYFLAQDAQPVTIYDSLNNAPFGLAFPFSLTVAGTYQLSYYGIDTSSNQESPHTVTLVLARGRRPWLRQCQRLPAADFRPRRRALGPSPVGADQFPGPGQSHRRQRAD